ncbi:MAG: metallophosphoesterase [Oryzomonas sp.]|uniref:metallophosphoesterase family protein n=1 Tax=Oryzomonas sp. TaxID=2855186 RepID=UPI002851372D|nr:metallophosphoesterase [Oryzomonas sp.]MDR3580980.1 metallophosphoesterase [Oryzomonas sp.]
MKVLVVSDTHGNYVSALQAHSLTEPVDAIIHLGDGVEDAKLLRSLMHLDVIAVSGNCDRDFTVPREMLWECEGKRILLVHGDAYGVKEGLEGLKQRAAEVRADIVLFGHSHRATCITRSGILFLNPGTLIQTSARKTFATLEISEDCIKARLHDIP